MSEHPEFIDTPDDETEPAPAMPAAPPSPPAAAPPGHPAFPVVMGLLFVALMAVAWLTQDGPAAAGPAPASEAKPAEPAAPAAAPAPAPPPAPATVDDLKPLKAELAAQLHRLDAVQKKLESLPPPPALDLGPIEAKVEALSKVPEMVAPLPGRIEELGGRIGAFDQKLATLQSEVAKAQQAAPPPVSAPKPDRPAPADAGAAIGPAAALYQQGKYAEALAAFRGLQQASPDDARVWYFSALAAGLATGRWTEGDAPQWVEKGIELEKAGTPAAAQIDAAFSGLTQVTGKDWLGFYRQRAKR